MTQIAWIGEVDKDWIDFVSKIDAIKRISMVQEKENENRESVETLMTNNLAEKQLTQSLKSSTETFIECLEHVRNILSEEKKLDENDKVCREFNHISWEEIRIRNLNCQHITNKLAFNNYRCLP